MPDRQQSLKEINEISFTINDLTLYMDTHPLDTNAFDAFSEAMKKRIELMQSFADNFEPLTIDFICMDTNNQTKTKTKYPDQKHFTWSDGPLPWDNQGGTL